MLKALMGISLLLVLSACGVSVIPIKSNDNVNIINDKIISQKNDIELSAKLVDLEIPPYRNDQHISSFFVEIKNLSNRDLNYSLESFVLVDNNGRQYNPISPDKLKSYFERDSSYLIPYPFVGYYYLQDKVEGSFQQSVAPEGNFYYTNRPQNLMIDALPIEVLRARSQISGLLFYNIDYYSINSFAMKAYLPAGNPEIFTEFQFSVKR